MLAIAENYPKDTVAIDALNKVLTLDGSRDEKKKAANLLVRDCLLSDKIAPLCQYFATKYDAASETLLRKILAKNPYRSAQAEASFALAQMLEQRYAIAKEAKQDRELTLPERIARETTAALTTLLFGETAEHRKGSLCVTFLSACRSVSLAGHT